MPPAATPLWLHRWAVGTVCATVVLLVLGAVVTTFRVGMADPVWPTYPWHLLLVSWQEPRSGFLIEHSHRLAGYVVGCCVIVLAAGLWLHAPHRWLRWLGVAALGAVIVQGLLGGFRVYLDRLLGPHLAVIHGCFAQVVLALLVSLALFTSPGWFRETGRSVAGAHRDWLRSWSWLTTGLVLVQIVFGALIRHTYSPLGQRGHLLLAFAVVVAVAVLAKEVLDNRTRDQSLDRAVALLAGLILVQVGLGVESWMVRFTATGAAYQAVIRTAHTLLGSLILATSVAVVLLQARHGRGWSIQPVTTPGKRLEGAA